MNNPEHFRELNSKALERLAREWAERYPIIKKVLLFRGQRGIHKYALVVLIDTPPITDPGNAQQQRSYGLRHRAVWPEATPFFDWSFGGESCNHIKDDLVGAYKKDLPIDKVAGKRRLPPEWIWFPIPVKNNLQIENSLPTDLIVPEVLWTLYDSDAQAHEEDEEAVPTGDEAPRNGIPDDHEAFIRNLKVFYESNSEIKIQKAGTLPKIVHCNSLNFRDETTKEWKAFIKILQTPEHTYRIDPTNSDSDRKLLERINEKLISSFNIPKGFKIYERIGEKAYKFKFQVLDNTNRIIKRLETKYSSFPKDQLLAEIDKLMDDYHDAITKKKPLNTQQAITSQINIAMSVAIENKYATENELKERIRDRIDSDSEVETSRLNPSEIGFQIRNHP